MASRRQGAEGTYPITTAIPGVTEIQAAGGIRAEIRCRDILRLDLSCALTVLTTVTSRPTSLRVVCDAGKESLSGDDSLREPVGMKLRIARLSEEHAILELEAANELPRVGDKVEFIVGHSETTVHLHDELHGLRDGQVEIVWPVARGRSR